MKDIRNVIVSSRKWYVTITAMYNCSKNQIWEDIRISTAIKQKTIM